MRTMLILFVPIMSLVTATTASADWPMHRAGAARQGYSAESLPAEISLLWVSRTIHQPQPAWPRDERMAFDRAAHVVVADGLVLFGSSADGKVYALDAATGILKWTFYTEGPIRVAPAVWENQVYVASDDGHLYCLSVQEGTLIRKWRGAPGDELALGNEQIISRWPARGGPVIRDGIVYYAAGIWQSEGVSLFAIEAKSGKVLWTNDSSGGIYMPQPHGGASAKSGVSAQGHLVATKDHILVPTGRAVPAVFQRSDGKFLYYKLQENGHRGGTSAVAFDKVFVNNGYPYETETGGLLRQLGDGPIAGMAEGFVQAVDGKLLGRQFIDKTVKDRKGNPVQTIDYVDSWSIAGVPGGVDLIVAGTTAISAKEGTIATVDLESRKLILTVSVEGVPYGLAASNGRLYATTDQGTIYCFGAKSDTQPAVHELQTITNPYGQNERYAAAATEILDKSKISEGYCIDMGCGDGALSYELAKRTKLHIFAIESDPQLVAEARQKLDAAGLYGSRVTVLQRDLDQTHYPKYIANLIVSGRAVSGDAQPTEAARVEIARLQRPYGGVVCIGTPGEIEANVRGALAKSGSWTHQYSSPANTLNSNDEIVKGPLHVLWFRDISLDLPQRHGRGPAPLFSEGRLFHEGMDELRAVDAYNGRPLWTFRMEGVLHPYSADHIVGTSGTGSNFCVAGDSVYARHGHVCYRLDAATGKKLGEFPAPKHTDGKPGVWGYIACEDGILFGSAVDEAHIVRHAWRPADMSKLFTESKFLFAMDAKTGKLKWRYDAKNSIRNNAIAIGDHRVFLIDRPVAQQDLLKNVEARRGEKIPDHETGELVVLNTETGQADWTNDKDVFGTMLVYSEKYDLLMMSYQSTRFKLPSEVGGRIAVFRASEGYRVWDKEVKYVTRPLVNDRTIYAEGGSWDLLTGEDQPFDFKRSYGCGQLAASKHLLLFRSATFGYFDSSRDAKTENFGGIRPGCWINSLPVGGLVLVPDASSGCRCSYQNRAWVALQGAD